MMVRDSVWLILVLSILVRDSFRRSGGFSLTLSKTTINH